jgi:hypothetical protein
LIFLYPSFLLSFQFLGFLGGLGDKQVVTVRPHQVIQSQGKARRSSLSNQQQVAKVTKLMTFASGSRKPASGLLKRSKVVNKNSKGSFLARRSHKQKQHLAQRMSCYLRRLDPVRGQARANPGAC